MTFEAGKEYVTRDGSKAKVYDDCGGRGYELLGAILTMEGWVTACWLKNGRFTAATPDHHWDIIPPRPPVVVSDAVMRAFYTAQGWVTDDCAGMVAVSKWRPTVAAAITAYLAEQEPR